MATLPYYLNYYHTIALYEPRIRIYVYVRSADHLGKKLNGSIFGICKSG